MGYTWRRGESIVSAEVEIRGDIVQAIDNYGGRDFADYKRDAGR